MRETQVYEYYAFGYNYYLLQNECKGIKIHGRRDSLLTRIRDFRETLKELDLQVTLQACENLKKIYYRARKLPKDATVDDDLAKKITKIINDIDVTLDAELKLRASYIVTPKRIPIENLLNKPEDSFAKDVFQKLPPICRYDFHEAGKCIAFALPTAAVFHIMRGTEGALRWYYCSIVKRKRVKVLLWNAMVESLRKRRKSPPRPLLDNLDSIRRNFRNPTQHPDARYDLDGAQDLYGVGIDAVNRMANDLKEREA